MFAGGDNQAGIYLVPTEDSREGRDGGISYEKRGVGGMSGHVHVGLWIQ